MYAYGADSSVNEFYHSWFGDGTPWDNVFTSLYGPPPGYLPGGPNKDFSIPAINPPGGQPPQKSFREWNTGWNGSSNENSWEITECGIYTQSAYISLLVRTMATSAQTALPLHSITLSGNRDNIGVHLQWLVDDANDTKHFTVERSIDKIHFTALKQLAAIPGIINYHSQDEDAVGIRGTIYYRIAAMSLNGAVLYSPVLTINYKGSADYFSAAPNPVINECTLTGYSASDGLSTLQLTDVSGKTLLRLNWDQPKGYYSKPIQLNQLPAGVYWLQLTHASNTQRLKIVRQ